MTKTRGFSAVMVVAASAVAFAFPTIAAADKCGGQQVDERFHNVQTIGDDRIIGSNNNDTIVAGNGDDLIDGRGGRDRLCGGRGEDTLKGGGDRDKLYGNRGDDKLEGGEGRDILVGGSGEDSCSGGEGFDIVSGCESGRGSR